jgi:hypothetical protein
MNKLEEYRDKRVTESTQFIPTAQDDRELINERNFYKSGFDAAIALDLPVKFAEWIKKEAWYGNINLNASESIWVRNKGFMSPKELYKYWIENIYKPE